VVIEHGVRVAVSIAATLRFMTSPAPQSTPDHGDRPLITAIRSGGQTGVDRGALDAARAVGVTTEGWCPAAGWAEDLPEAPGLLVDYPELRETPSSEPAQRTEWNVRDSDVTLIIGSDVEPGGSEVSPGTTLTRGLASFHGRPVRAVGREDIEDACGWLQCQGTGLTVNIAGPRESEWPGAYEAAFRIVGELLRRSSGPPSATR
jgi:hypothetical protein